MQYGKCRTHGLWLLVVLILDIVVHQVAYTQDLPQSTLLTLQGAIDRALASNPGIRASGFDIAIERSRRDLAAFTQPLMLQGELENFLGSGSVNGVDNAETTLQLTKALEMGGKRDLRTQLGNARIALAEKDQVLARLDLAAEVTRRYIEMIVRQEELELSREAIEFATATLEIVRQRVEVGRTSEAELATAEIALARSELNRESSERRLESAQINLATLWGAEEFDFQRSAADLFELPNVAAIADLKARIAENPDLLRVIDERRVIEAERRLAGSRRRSDLSLSFGVRHLAQIDASALVFSVSAPLGSAARSTPQVAESDARLSQLPARTEQRRLEIIAALHELHAELSSSYRRYTVLRDDLLPRSEAATALYREGFELSSYTLLEFNQSQNDLLALRQDALAAAASYHLILVDIEQLLGGTYRTGIIQ